MPVPPRIRDADNGAYADLFEQNGVDIDKAIVWAAKEIDQLLRVDMAACDQHYSRRVSGVCKMLLTLNTIVRTNPSILGKGVKIPAGALGSVRHDGLSASPIGEPRQGKYSQVPRPVDHAD